jgi:hypothetical protein
MEKAQNLQDVDSNMDLATFCQALIHCGVVQAFTKNSIITQGYGDMDVFTHFLANAWAFMDLVKSINKLPVAPDGDQPLIPFASIHLLQAMRHWTIERKRCGLEVIHNKMTQAELTRTLRHMEDEEQIMDMKSVWSPLPNRFSSFGTKWHIFSLGFKGHCVIVCGIMNFPLAYVLQDHEMVKPKIGDVDYTTTNKRLMNLVVLSGRIFNKLSWFGNCSIH